MEIAKITEIRNIFSRYENDKDKQPYIFDMYYSVPGDDALVMRVGRDSNTTGADKFQEIIDDTVQNLKADVIVVTAYKSLRSKGIIKTWHIQIGDVEEGKSQRMQHPIASNNKPEIKETQTEEIGFGGLSGFDGVEKYMGMQGSIMQKDLQIQLLTNDKERTETELLDSKRKYEELERDYDILYKEAERLEEFAEKARKYIPGENDTTLAGMKMTELLSALGTKIVTNIAKKNPESTAKILGISTDDLGSLLNDEPEKPAIEKTSAASNLTPEQIQHIEKCDKIYDICQQLKPEYIVKILQYFKFISSDEGNIDLIDKFINEQNN